MLRSILIACEPAVGTRSVGLHFTYSCERFCTLMSWRHCKFIPRQQISVIDQLSLVFKKLLYPWCRANHKSTWAWPACLEWGQNLGADGDIPTGNVNWDLVQQEWRRCNTRKQPPLQSNGKPGSSSWQSVHILLLCQSLTNDTHEGLQFIVSYDWFWATTVL